LTKYQLRNLSFFFLCHSNPLPKNSLIIKIWNIEGSKETDSNQNTQIKWTIVLSIISTATLLIRTSTIIVWGRNDDEKHYCPLTDHFVVVPTSAHEARPGFPGRHYVIGNRKVNDPGLDNAGPGQPVAGQLVEGPQPVEAEEEPRIEEAVDIVVGLPGSPHKIVVVDEPFVDCGPCRKQVWQHIQNFSKRIFNEKKEMRY
jgi:hypothetical protein